VNDLAGTEADREAREAANLARIGRQGMLGASPVTPPDQIVASAPITPHPAVQPQPQPQPPPADAGRRGDPFMMFHGGAGVGGPRRQFGGTGLAGGRAAGEEMMMDDHMDGLDDDDQELQLQQEQQQPRVRGGDDLGHGEFRVTRTDQMIDQDELVTVLSSCRDLCSAEGYGGAVSALTGVGVEDGLGAAMSLAKNTFRILLIVVAIPGDPHSDELWASLTSPFVSDFVRENFLLWAGDASGVDLAPLRWHDTPPYLLALGNIGTMTVLERHQGALGPDALFSKLLDLAVFDPMLASAREIRAASDTVAHLRDEQDVDMREAERVDEERLRKAEAEALEREAAAQRQEEVLEARRQRRAALAAEVGPEPAAGPPGEVTTIALRFPTGEIVKRRFLAADPVKRLRDFTESKLDLEIAEDGFTILTNFPRKQIWSSANPAQEDSTLAAAGLAPSATLFVETKRD
jgi:hypothetical protein